MVYKFAALIGLVAIAMTPWSNRIDVEATEYVFTAPPEVDRQLEEIPASETEYPLYECNSESADKDEALDSHNCNCIDCEDTTQDSPSEASDDRATSQNKPDRN